MLRFFISHMVQMKLKAPDQIPACFLSLYPTWFRWNCNFFFFNFYFFKLYIPHGSDETLMVLNRDGSLLFFISHMVQMKHMLLISAETGLYPLYPTWFRWNLLQRGDTWKIWTLYIPHGSDETGTAYYFYGDKVFFISHMVQMKLNLIWLL